MLTYEVVELEFSIMVRVWNKTHTDHMQRGMRRSRWAWVNHRRIRKAMRELERIICIDGSPYWAREYLSEEPHP